MQNSLPAGGWASPIDRQDGGCGCIDSSWIRQFDTWKNNRLTSESDRDSVVRIVDTYRSDPDY